LPRLETRTSEWSYGFGDFDEATNRVSAFTPFAHYDAASARWQAGSAVPDPQFGYVFLTASGGHPDVPGRAVIRRFTITVSGQVSVTGQLSHGSENGNGVRGRLVSSRSGKAGEWLAFHGTTATPVADLAVEPGDTLDFITDANGMHTSDSFTWPVTLTVKSAGQNDRTIAAADAFQGPTDSPDKLPGQIVRAWQLALCRTPSADEVQMAMQFAAEQLQTLEHSSVALPSGRTAVRQTLINLCQALYSSNEFLYVD